MEPVIRDSRQRAAARMRAPSMLLGRYEILEKLGEGGMGVVYRARDKQLGRDIAIKLVVTGEEANDTHAARLLREAQALAQLSHPNVVAVYDVGRAEGGVFVAMELVSGVAGDVWLRTRRPWQEVVRVFRDLARGLAAAHAVGLVHRDFKPANIILGSDGRARVLDFGLARAADLPRSSGDVAISSDSIEQVDESVERPTARLAGPMGAENSVPLPTGPSPSLLDSPLTRAGAVVGTPPYMAPEQHLGAPCDPRTDQFSFCVAFYRALYGERPFGGAVYSELKANITSGNVRAEPVGSGVPGWLRAIVLRGLAVDPDQRWPSMSAIIEALGRDPMARRRKLALAGAVVVSLAGAGALVWHLRRDPAEACGGSEQQLANVWDDARKSAVRGAFTKTATPFAADALTSVQRRLDTYAARWVGMRTDACMATHAHGTQSADLLDLRMECLQRRLDDVHALVDVLAVADAAVVARAVEAVGGLPPLDGCADADALRAPVPRPTDPALRARVDTARRTIASAHALWAAGRYAEAQRQLAPILGEATALGWRPLQGEVLLAQARLSDSIGDYAAAAKHYKEAANAAEAGRDDETAARARNGLVWVIGERLGRYDEAHEIARDAAAKIERLGRHELLQADLDQKVAALFLAQGNYKEAEQRSRRVLEIRQKLLDADAPEIGSALGDLGDVAAQSTRYDEAIDYYKRALANIERALGPDHAMCGMLRTNLATTLRAKGNNKDALVQLEKARTISERALGSEHAQLANIAINIGGILLDERRLADAEAQFRKASEIWTRSLGADHPNVGTALYRMGQIALEQGHTDEATAAFRRTLGIWEAKLGPEHPSLAAALAGLGDAALAAKQPAAALAHYQRALVLLEKSLGPTHAEVEDMRKTIARARAGVR
jgi:tetratricopeptide (TPR) repeat protein/tRNA A-37 threonylcarbamoyl transferase component Bud32